MRIPGIQPAFSGGSVRIPVRDRRAIVPAVDSVHFSGSNVCHDRKVKIGTLCRKLGIPAPKNEKAYLLMNRALNAPYVNHKLAFVGDTAITLVVRDFLMHRYPDLNEGSLSQLASVLSCSRALTTIGDSIGLQDYLKYTKKDAARFNENPKSRETMVANALKALAGALLVSDSNRLQSLRSMLQPRLEKMLGEVPVAQFGQPDVECDTSHTGQIARELWPLASDSVKDEGNPLACADL